VLAEFVHGQFGPLEQVLETTSLEFVPGIDQKAPRGLYNASEVREARQCDLVPLERLVTLLEGCGAKLRGDVDEDAHEEPPGLTL
jgi:hypothetical protein